MRKKACKGCPFRIGSKLGYDADAMEWLKLGEDPACHELVGLDAIFADAPLTPAKLLCRGFALWQSGHKDFARPAIAALEKKDG